MVALKKRPAYLYILMVLDWLTILAALSIAITLRGREFAGEFRFVGAPLEWEAIFLCLFSAAATMGFTYLGLYSVNVFITVADQTVRILKALFFAVLSLALLAFFIRTDWILDSRLALIYFVLIASFLLIGGRAIVFLVVQAKSVQPQCADHRCWREWQEPCYQHLPERSSWFEPCGFP
jgi:FlaA1/EpsC-like NDP-sugar epimerase